MRQILLRDAYAVILDGNYHLFAVGFKADLYIAVLFSVSDAVSDKVVHHQNEKLAVDREGDASAAFKGYLYALFRYDIKIIAERRDKLREIGRRFFVFVRMIFDV